MSGSSLTDVRHPLPPLKALTTLRLAAAMYVVVYHMNFQQTLGDHPLLANLLGSGYTGVTLFFVLSGFILAYNYSQIRSVKDFWVARFARIYPAYFLAGLFAVLRPVDWHFPHFIPKSIAGFLLVQGWWPSFGDALNQYGWTISVEAFFYLVFPFLLPLVQKIQLRTFILIQAAYLLLLIGPIFLAHAGHRNAGMGMVGVLEGQIPLVRLNAFFVGAFCGTVWLRRLPHRMSIDAGSVKRHWLPWLALLACLMLAGASWDMSALALRTGLLVYADALLIYGLAEAEWSALSSHWMQVGGEISYGIYILQSPVALTYAMVYRHLAPGASPSRWLYVLLLIAVAYASFRWFETPARLLIRRRFGDSRVSVRPV